MTTKKNNQGSGKNTVANQIDALSRASDVLSLPNGYTFKTEEEKTLWSYFASSRAVTDWDDGHKLVLYNLVKNQCRVNNENNLLDEEGTVHYNDKGNPCINPRVNAISTFERLIQSNIRVLGLQATDGESATIKKRAKEAKNAKDTVNKVGKMSLLAQAK